MEIKAIIKIIFVLLASCTIRTQCQEENKYLRDLLLIDRIAGAHFVSIFYKFIYTLAHDLYMMYFILEGDNSCY